MLQVLRKKPKSETPQPVPTLPQVILPPAIHRYRAGPRITAMGITDHSLLSNLLVDKHTQYALADKTRPTPWVSETDVPVLTDAKYPNALLLDGSRKPTADFIPATDGLFLGETTTPRRWDGSKLINLPIILIFGFFTGEIYYPNVQYYPLNGHANITGTTEALANCPLWNGTFLFARFNIIDLSEGATVRFTLRKNGADTAMDISADSIGIYEFGGGMSTAEPDVFCWRVSVTTETEAICRFIPTLFFKTAF
jgi:hypothetical protein